MDIEKEQDCTLEQQEQQEDCILEQQVQQEENSMINKVNFKRISYLRQRVKTLLKKPQPVQRSPEWFFTRNTIITASEAASCLTMSKTVCENYAKLYNLTNFKFNDTKSTNSYEKLEDYIIKKCKAFNGENVFFDSKYTLWGKKYEEVALNLYKFIKKTEVYEFGLLKHPHFSWLGASPDGISKDGVMLEIKCPLTRKITGIPPLHYFIQVQIQLECALLDEADFLECEIKEVDSLEEFLDVKDIPKGILINLIDEPDNSETKYIYQNAKEWDIDPCEWAEEKVKTLQEKSYQFIYYKIVKYNIVNIKRDKEWFNSIKKDLIEVHKKIRFYQNNKIEYDNYYNSIKLLKNKKHIQNINESVCLLD
jgi:putative phage-type endonuclease